MISWSYELKLPLKLSFEAILPNAAPGVALKLDFNNFESGSGFMQGFSSEKPEQLNHGAVWLVKQTVVDALRGNSGACKELLGHQRQAWAYDGSCPHP